MLSRRGRSGTSRTHDLWRVPTRLGSAVLGLGLIACQAPSTPHARAGGETTIRPAPTASESSAPILTLPPRVAQCSKDFGAPNRRLSRFELAYAIEDVFGVQAQRLHGLPAPRRSIGEVPDILVGQLLDTDGAFRQAYAEHVAALAIEISPSIARRCGSARDAAACVLGALREPLGLLYRVAPVDDRSDDVVQLQAVIAAAGKSARAMAEAGIVHLLLSPRFLEVENQPRAGADLAAHERRSLATRLALVLWSSVPDVPLLSLAAAGQLEDPVNLERQITRMQADPKFQRFSAEFSRQWLRLDRPPQFRPSLERRDLLSDPKRFFEVHAEAALLIRSNFDARDPLRSLIDGESSLITSRAVLTALSSPIKGGGDENWLGRGLVVQGAFLCRNFPLAAVYPSDIWHGHPLLDPVRGEHTPRPGEPQLLQTRTHDQPCAQCHLQLETLGAALSEYDGLGERSSVRASTHVNAERFGRIGTERVTSPEQLGQWLLESRRFEPCFAQKLATYVLGRAVLPARRLGDRCLVAALTPASSQPTLAGMLDELLHSPEFRRAGTQIVRERPIPIPNAMTYRQPIALPKANPDECAGFAPQTYLTENCGTSACHGAGSASGGFVFGDEASTRRALRGLRPRADGYCKQYDSYLSIKEPAQSLVVQKLLGGDVCGAPMPITGGPASLGSVELGCLVDWFAAVARNEN